MGRGARRISTTSASFHFCDRQSTHIQNLQNRPRHSNPLLFYEGSGGSFYCKPFPMQDYGPFDMREREREGDRQTDRQKRENPDAHSVTTVGWG